MKNISLFLILFGAMFIFLSACKEEETVPPVNNDPQDPIYSVNKAKDQVYPFEIASVEISGLSNLNEEYPGKFGNLNITLRKGSGNQLFFIVPDINEGKHNLELSLNNNTRTVEFTVLKGLNFSNPKDFLLSFINEAQTQIADHEGLDAVSGIVEKQKALLSQVESGLDQLEPKEVLEVVGILSANGLLRPYIDSPDNRNSWNCLETNGQALLVQLESNLTFPASIGRLTQVPVSAVSRYAALATVLNMRIYYLSLNTKAIDLMDCRVLRSFGFDESGARIIAKANDEPLEFESGVSMSFSLFGTYEGLSTGDRNHGLAQIASFARAVDQIGNRLNQVNEASGPLNTAFNLNVSNLSSTDKVNLPEEAIKEVVALSDASYSVESISNNLVELKTLTATSDGVILSFLSTSGGVQEFTFKLILQDGPIKIEKELQAKVSLVCDLELDVKVEGSSATATVKNAKDPVVFSWSNGGSGNSQSNLSPGAYTVTAKDALGCEVSQNFTIVEEQEGGTVKDHEGNEYATVKIGNQIWMAENLRVSTYADGTPIPEVRPNTEWRSMTSGAFCWYDNAPEFDELYGKLYNWYALNCCQICPEGWHVPNLDEWETLRLFLLPDSGGKMKTVEGWRGPNTGATNSSGFSGLPGGVRGFNGNFFSVTEYGHWWVAGETNATSARYMFMGFDNASVQYATFNPKWNGASIRCLKD